MSDRDKAGSGQVGHLQFRKIPFEEMEALLHGLPFYIILSVVVQSIWGSPPSRGATLRKEGLEAKFEFCLFSEVERIYLGVGVEFGRLLVSPGVDAKRALPFRARARV